ncbi:DUF4112 domain-containing protein [Citreimonas sp.]|uniref:DUF4112 domain-containing protein n=1 Tax=Citreimonas sp. TaxID=3036715 RepID=UPI0040594B4F
MDTHRDYTRLARAEKIARRMDNAVRIPFTRMTFGMDAVLGLVPGVGDALAMLPSLYILQVANMAGAPRRLLAKMATNIAIDWAIGVVPLVGDIFDIAYKANLRNVALLRAHIELRHAMPRGGDTPPSNVVQLFPQPDDPGPDAPPLTGMPAQRPFL